MAELDRPGDVGRNGSEPGADAERVSETRAATTAADGIYGVDASQDGQLEESLIVGFRYGNGEGSLLELWIRLRLWRGVLAPVCFISGFTHPTALDEHREPHYRGYPTGGE